MVAALRTPEQDIQAEAEGDSTIYKGFTSFVESNLSNEALSKVSDTVPPRVPHVAS